MQTVFLATLLLALSSGCASHGTWSKSDLGAWTDLGERIGSNEKSYYVERWGLPVSRQDTTFSDGNGNVTKDGEELLWLWKADGTRLSDQHGQGWELLLSFDKQGAYRNWRIGGYRSALTLSDAIAATRKFEYRVGEDLLGELGFLKEQHGIAGNRFKYGSSNYITRELDVVNEQYSTGPTWRGWAIIRLQDMVRVVAQATLRADSAARNLHGRLATDDEVLKWVKDQATTSTRSRRPNPASQGEHNSGISENVQSGLLGRGFLGPYTPNAYGPGMNADATARPFIWQPDPGFGQVDPFSRVQPNAYGPGIGMDQYGRPVRPACPPGWTGPC